MCGVSGILHKSGASSGGLSPVGEQLIRMLEPMTHRGRDSSGVTIVGEDLEGRPGCAYLDRQRSGSR